MEDTQEVSFRKGIDGKAAVVGDLLPFAARLTRAGRGVKTSRKE